MKIIRRANRKGQDFKQLKREEDHTMKVGPEYQETNCSKRRLPIAITIIALIMGALSCGLMPGGGPKLIRGILCTTGTRHNRICRATNSNDRHYSQGGRMGKSQFLLMWLKKRRLSGSNTKLMQPGYHSFLILHRPGKWSQLLV